MIVRYTRRAQGDLAKILNCVDKRSPRGALNVKLAIKRTIDTIRENPNIGNPAAKGAIRSLAVGRYPYLVFWTVEAGEIWVFHIRHGARRSGAAEQRPRALMAAPQFLGSNRGRYGASSRQSGRNDFRGVRERP